MLHLLSAVTLLAALQGPPSTPPPVPAAAPAPVQAAAAAAPIQSAQAALPALPAPPGELGKGPARRRPAGEGGGREGSPPLRSSGRGPGVLPAQAAAVRRGRAADGALLRGGRGGGGDGAA